MLKSTYHDDLTHRIIGLEALQYTCYATFRFICRYLIEQLDSDDTHYRKIIIEKSDINTFDDEI